MTSHLWSRREVGMQARRIIKGKGEGLLLLLGSRRKATNNIRAGEVKLARAVLISPISEVYLDPFQHAGRHFRHTWHVQ